MRLIGWVELVCSSMLFVTATSVLQIVFALYTVLAIAVMWILDLQELMPQFKLTAFYIAGYFLAPLLTVIYWFGLWFQIITEFLRIPDLLELLVSGLIWLSERSLNRTTQNESDGLKKIYEGIWIFLLVGIAILVNGHSVLLLLYWHQLSVLTYLDVLLLSFFVLEVVAIASLMIYYGLNDIAYDLWHAKTQWTNIPKCN